MPTGKALDIDAYVQARAGGATQIEAVIVSGSVSAPGKAASATGSGIESRPGVKERIQRLKDAAFERMVKAWGKGTRWTNEVFDGTVESTNMDKIALLNTAGRVVGAFAPSVIEHHSFKVPMRSLLDGAKVIDANPAPPSPPPAPALDDIPCDP